jgi:hypothetical protein
MLMVVIFPFYLWTSMSSLFVCLCMNVFMYVLFVQVSIYYESTSIITTNGCFCDCGSSFPRIVYNASIKLATLVWYLVDIHYNIWLQVIKSLISNWWGVKTLAEGKIDYIVQPFLVDWIWWWVDWTF